MQHYVRTSSQTKRHTTCSTMRELPIGHRHTTCSTIRELPIGQRGIPHTALHKNFQQDKEAYHTQHYTRTSNWTKSRTTRSTTWELPIGQRGIPHPPLQKNFQQDKGSYHMLHWPLELLIPAGLGASGSRWILQSMGMSLVVGGLYSCTCMTHTIQ